MLHAGKSKYFAEHLNKCLDDLGLPADRRNRSAILSKMLNIPRQQTRMIIEGYQLPTENVLLSLEKEFDLDTKSLLAKK